jgi:hypothetical protein
MVSLLFVDPEGNYRGLGDLWDASRDAMKYNQNNPVVCHPPCSGVSNYATSGIVPYIDHGFFKFSLETIIRVGGVIEHPRGSQPCRAIFLRNKKKPILDT